jgi:hypothetical protein
MRLAGYTHHLLGIPRVVADFMRSADMPKVVNTFTGASTLDASILLPIHADPNVPLTLWLIIERQVHIIRWLDGAEVAWLALWPACIQATVITWMLA